MKASRLNLPLRNKMLNTLGEVLLAARAPMLSLDEETVCNTAIKRSGLSDFGNPYYRQGLIKFLESAKADANLHPAGRLMINDMTTNFLVQRLRMVETRKREPEIFEKQLMPPLIICGPARSGTTFLHNLLALDPAHRALPQWLLMYPFPESPGKDVDPDPRIKMAEQGLQFRQSFIPGIDTKHYTRADTYEECILALGLTFNSLVFFSLFPVYSYQDWYINVEDMSKKYQEYRWLLQVFQSHEPGQRLTMKAPDHTGSLKALVEAVPQAMIIQTYRDLVECISSACSLLYTFHLGVSKEIDIQRLAKLTLQGYETFGNRNLAFREKNPGLIYDVFYDSLVVDPIGTVRGIYAHFDLPWTESYENELEAYIEKNKKDKHGKHKYSAAEFGLTEDEITERSKAFSEYFGQ